MDQRKRTTRQFGDFQYTDDDEDGTGGSEGGALLDDDNGVGVGHNRVDGDVSTDYSDEDELDDDTGSGTLEQLEPDDEEHPRVTTLEAVDSDGYARALSDTSRSSTDDELTTRIVRDRPTPIVPIESTDVDELQDAIRAARNAAGSANSQFGTDQTASLLDQAREQFSANFELHAIDNNTAHMGHEITMVSAEKPGNADRDSRWFKIYHVLCQIIPKEALHADAKRFGDFDLSKLLGQDCYRTFRFMAKALCNPKAGCTLETNDPYIPLMPTGLYQGKRKVLVAMEPLFKESMRDGITIPTFELMSSTNIVGFRVWYFIADPSIDPMKAVLDMMEQNREEKGQSDIPIQLDIGHEYTTILHNMQFREDSFRTSRYVDQTVAIQTRMIREAQLKKKAHDQLAKNNESALTIKHREVSTPVEWWNLIRCPNSRCMQCTMISKCQRCLTVQNAAEYIALMPVKMKQTRRPDGVIVEEIDFSIEIPPEQTTETPAGAPTTPVSPPAATLENVFDDEDELAGSTAYQIAPSDNPSNYLVEYILREKINRGELSIRPVSQSDPVMAAVNMVTKFDYAQHRKRLHHFIDPEFFLQMYSPTAAAIALEIGVCVQQRDVANYRYDTGGTRYYNFPLPEYVFFYDPNLVYGDDFIETEMPWAFNHFMALTEHMEDLLKNRKLRRPTPQSEAFFNRCDANPDISSAHREFSELCRRHSEKPANIITNTVQAGTRWFRGATPIGNVPDNRRTAVIEDDPNVVRCREDSYGEAKIFVEMMGRYTHLAPFLMDNERMSLLSLIRQQGMDTVKRLFSGNTVVLPAIRKAALHIKKITNNSGTAYKGLPRAAHSLKNYHSEWLVSMYFHFEKQGILNNHEFPLMVYLAACRAAHCPITDRLFGFAILIINLWIIGVASVGKSFMAQKAAENMLPDTINSRAGLSDKAQFDPQPKGGQIDAWDEIPSYLDPGKKGSRDPGADEQANLVKEVQTGFFYRYLRTQIARDDGGKGASMVKDQKTMEIACCNHNAFMAVGNDLMANPDGGEISVITRWMLLLIFANIPRSGRRNDITMKMIRHNLGTVANIMSSENKKKQDSMVDNHAFHILLSVAISVGAICAPNINMYTTHAAHVHEKMVRKFPHMALHNRTAERGVGMAVTITMLQAQYLFFNSVISPLACINQEKRKIRFLPFSIDQIRFIEPFMFMSEAAAVSTILDVFHNQYLPHTWVNILRDIAIKWCGFGDDTSKWEFARQTIGGVDVIDYNYIRSRIDVRKIIEWLNRRNYYTTNTHVARWIIRWFSAISYRTTFRDAENRPTAEKAPLKVLIIEEPLLERVGSDEDRLERSYIRINPYFLQKCTFDKLTRSIMKVINYNGIRPTEVAIPIAVENLPFLPRTVKLEPSARTLKIVPHAEENPVDSAFNMNDVLDSEGLAVDRLYDMPTSSDTYEFCGTNAEDTLYAEWYNKCVTKLPGFTVDMFMPSKVNARIEERTNLYFPNSHRVNYPADYIAAYETVPNPSLAADGLSNRPPPPEPVEEEDELAVETAPPRSGFRWARQHAQQQQAIAGERNVRQRISSSSSSEVPAHHAFPIPEVPRPPVPYNVRIPNQHDPNKNTNAAPAPRASLSRFQQH